MSIYQVFGIILLLTPELGMVDWITADGGIKLAAECILKTAGIIAGAFAYSAALAWLPTH